MLISFTLQGYGLYSIIFSTLSIFVSWWFAVMYWNDFRKANVHPLPARTFKAALFFNVISAAGPFYLAYMRATKSVSTSHYTASIYYFLHFQYNGWFFFGCLALHFFWLSFSGHTIKRETIIFTLFAAVCIPAYFLSMLWLRIPSWLHIVLAAAALLQIIGYFLLIKSARPLLMQSFHSARHVGKWLLILAGFSLGIKLFLQLGSAAPALSQLAFGSRPVIIGYLHIVLLGVITLFLLGFAVTHGWLKNNSLLRAGCIFLLPVLSLMNFS